MKQPLPKTAPPPTAPTQHLGSVHTTDLAGFAHSIMGNIIHPAMPRDQWIYSQDGLWRQITDGMAHCNTSTTTTPDSMDNNPDADICHPPDPADPLPVPDPTGYCGGASRSGRRPHSPGGRTNPRQPDQVSPCYRCRLHLSHCPRRQRLCFVRQ